MIPHKYLYSSLFDIILMVHGIDTAKTWKKKKINLHEDLKANRKAVEDYIQRTSYLREKNSNKKKK